MFSQHTATASETFFTQKAPPPQNSQIFAWTTCWNALGN